MIVRESETEVAARNRELLDGIFCGFPSSIESAPGSNRASVASAQNQFANAVSPAKHEA